MLQSEKNDFWTEALFQFGVITGFECRSAVMHRCLHLLVGRVCVGWRGADGGNASLYVNRHTPLVQKIDTQNPVNLSPARIPDGTQIDSGEPQVLEPMIS